MNSEKSSALFVIDTQHSCWKPDATSGVLREKCLAVLKDYFGRKAE